MRGNYLNLNYHFVFSTKNRTTLILPVHQASVWRYMAGIAKSNGMKPYAIGGTDDHVHALVALPPTLSVSKALQFIKGGSSKWINETFPEMRGFAWQDGYGAFTFAQPALKKLNEYVSNQRQHHEKQGYEEEMEILAGRVE